MPNQPATPLPDFEHEQPLSAADLNAIAKQLVEQMQGLNGINVRTFSGEQIVIECLGKETLTGSEVLQGPMVLGVVKYGMPTYTVDLYGTTIASLSEAPTQVNVLTHTTTGVDFSYGELVCVVPYNDTYYIAKFMDSKLSYELVDSGKVCVRVDYVSSNQIAPIKTHLLFDFVNLPAEIFDGGEFWTAFTFAGCCGACTTSRSYLTPVPYRSEYAGKLVTLVDSFRAAPATRVVGDMLRATTGFISPSSLTATPTPVGSVFHGTPGIWPYWGLEDPPIISSALSTWSTANIITGTGDSITLDERQPGGSIPLSEFYNWPNPDLITYPSGGSIAYSLGSNTASAVDALCPVLYEAEPNTHWYPIFLAYITFHGYIRYSEYFPQGSETIDPPDTLTNGPVPHAIAVNWAVTRAGFVGSPNGWDRVRVLAAAMTPLTYSPVPLSDAFAVQPQTIRVRPLPSFGATFRDYFSFMVYSRDEFNNEIHGFRDTWGDYMPDPWYIDYALEIN